MKKIIFMLLLMLIPTIGLTQNIGIKNKNDSIVYTGMQLNDSKVTDIPITDSSIDSTKAYPILKSTAVWPILIGAVADSTNFDVEIMGSGIDPITNLLTSVPIDTISVTSENQDDSKQVPIIANGIYKYFWCRVYSSGLVAEQLKVRLIHCTYNE